MYIWYFWLTIQNRIEYLLSNKNIWQKSQVLFVDFSRNQKLLETFCDVNFILV